MKLNNRRMMEAMKRLGITQKEIDATEVIIKTPEKLIVIKQPQVVKVNLMGQETFQVVGIIEEKSLNDSNEDSNDEFNPSKEDIKIIMEKTGVSEEEAIRVLKKNKGDIAASILELEESPTSQD